MIRPIPEGERTEVRSRQDEVVLPSLRFLPRHVGKHSLNTDVRTIWSTSKT